MYEAIGNMHMHTPYSDGEKWHQEIAEDAIRAGLDFIIVTDHNVWVNGLEGYYRSENGRVLLLAGEEVHNARRNPQASHLLVYGAEQELSCYAADPQNLINQVKATGGYCFLAHPHEKDFPLADYPNLGWHDWPVEGFTGLEIWNYMSSFVCRLTERLQKLSNPSGLLAKLVALQYALHPERHITAPEPETLALWDELLAQGKQITAVGNSDAHGTPMSLGPITRIIFPYEFLFRAVNTHILTSQPLNGDFHHDKRLVLEAIGKGNSWIGYDMACSTKGFRFTGQGVNKGRMGDRIRLDAGATLQIAVPQKATIRLVRHGRVVAQAQNSTHLTHIPVEEGAYRVECLIQYEGKERGWIYSNPIYLW